MSAAVLAVLIGVTWVVHWLAAQPWAARVVPTNDADTLGATWPTALAGALTLTLSQWLFVALYFGIWHPLGWDILALPTQWLLCGAGAAGVWHLARRYRPQVTARYQWPALPGVLAGTGLASALVLLYPPTAALTWLAAANAVALAFPALLLILAGLRHRLHRVTAPALLLGTPLELLSTSLLALALLGLTAGS